MRQPEPGGGGLGEGVLTPVIDRAALLADAGLARDGAGRLRLDGVDLETLAGAVGTPVFVYGAAVIRRQYRAFDEALGGVPHRVHFAVKANGNLAVLALLRSLGAGADIVSAGELARCLAAGFPADRIVFSGVGKTGAELEAAAAGGLASINVESVEELDALGAVAERLSREVRVGIRFNPDVTTDTHPYISTGKYGIKFGVPADQAAEAIAVLARRPGLRLVTLAVHVGSQILDASPFRAGAARLVELLSQVRTAGIETVRSLDVGGGVGIRYGGELPLSPAAYAEAIVPVLAPAGLEVHLEPGRFLVGNAGVLLARVLYRKHSGGKDFLVLDAGMTELGRPSRYGAYHDIVPVAPRRGAETPFDVVGPVCETGDFLALERPLPDGIAPGHLLAILGAGAYGFVMGSTYNARPRPPEVLVDGGRWGLARRRETVEELMAGEDPDPVMTA